MNKASAFALNYTDYQDMFRSMLMIYNTDNYLNIEDLAKQSADFCKTKLEEDDPAVLQRFAESIQKSLQFYSSDKKVLNETEFCKMMTEVYANIDVETEYTRTLRKIFCCADKQKVKYIDMPTFRKLLSRTGYVLNDKEFADLVKDNFEGTKDSITEEEFLQFATNSYNKKKSAEKTK